MARLPVSCGFYLGQKSSRKNKLSNISDNGDIVNKIYVGNLSYDVSEQDLESLFTEFGKELQVKLIKDFETGRSKGFAFIEFDNASNAQSALKTDGKEFQGRRLKVNLARDKPARSSGDRSGSRW